MVQTCIKCGRNEVEYSDLIFFVLPSKTDFPYWYNEIIKHLGIEDSDVNLSDDIHICERHFRSEDIEVEGNTIRLKENAMLIPEEEEIDKVYLRPELIYHDEDIKDVRIIGEDDDEQFLNTVESQNQYDQDEDSYEYTIQENIETEIIEDVGSNGKVVLSDDENQTFSVISSENGQYQPVMPFYLSDSSIFTIMNENDEVGETIILQIENSDPQEEEQDEESFLPVVPPIKKAERDDFKVALIEKQLCRPKDDDVVHCYTCDICEYSYGCFNCLKSHYETMHVTNSNVAHYKCKYAIIYTKGLCCPVCELMFESRNDTLDHYITHAVACSICCSGFDRQLFLTDHMMTVHSTADPEVIYECELCKTEYHNSPALAKHYQTIHKMILCCNCKLRFVSTNQLMEHEKIHVKKLNVLPYACSKCNKAFPQISDIAVHIRHDHKKKPKVTTDPELQPIYDYQKKMWEMNRVYIVSKDSVDLLPRKRVKVKK